MTRTPAARRPVTFWYLASPYSKYPGGIAPAFTLAVENTGLLIRAGVPVFSPIAHTHPIAVLCGIDPLDHAIWMPADKPMMAAASGLIMLTAESWQASYGMQIERQTFEAAGKPVVWMTPGQVPFDVLCPVRWPA